MIHWPRIFTLISLAAGCMLAGGCVASRQDVLYQTSTIDALLTGVYDGDRTCREVLRHGDFGIGTFDRLDGEMVLLDGKLYQVRGNGEVRMPDLSITTPFAVVCKFEADLAFALPEGADFDRVERLVDRQLINPNVFYAVKIRGKFSQMRTRSVPDQTKPYRPLALVTDDQREFRMKDVKGTIVGFRCPKFSKGINVPGYHLHFISEDRKQGGHVLGFEVEEATVEVDRLSHLFLALPENSHAFSRADLGADRSRELRKVEKGD